MKHCKSSKTRQSRPRRTEVSLPTAAPDHDQAEHRHLLNTLASHSGSIPESARALGMTREELQRALRRHGISDAL
jgi:transcriptional regulator of acetoin/glycerol metabolism